jgi:hypothetical protein
MADAGSNIDDRSLNLEAAGTLGANVGQGNGRAVTAADQAKSAGGNITERTDIKITDSSRDNTAMLAGSTIGDGNTINLTDGGATAAALAAMQANAETTMDFLTQQNANNATMANNTVNANAVVALGAQDTARDMQANSLAYSYAENTRNAAERENAAERQHELNTTMMDAFVNGTAANLGTAQELTTTAGEVSLAAIAGGTALGEKAIDANLDFGGQVLDANLASQGMAFDFATQNNADLIATVDKVLGNQQNATLQAMSYANNTASSANQNMSDLARTTVDRFTADATTDTTNQRNILYAAIGLIAALVVIVGGVAFTRRGK